MQSAFDIQISYMTQILKQSNRDSQYLSLQINQLKQHLQLLHKNIQTKLQAINKQISPKIEQLQSKIDIYWAGVKEMDQQAWKQLEQQQMIFHNCTQIVQEMEQRTNNIQENI